MSVKSARGFFTTAKRFHLVGIAGIGMSGIAQFLVHRGCGVQGSDRSFDQRGQGELRAKLERQGIRVVPQDGSAIHEFQTGFLVTSAAVEETNPDIAAAIRAGAVIMSRAEILARIFQEFPRRIAIAGTSGKTTVSAMVAAVLARAGLQPTAVVGGIMRDTESDELVGNFRPGGPETICIEADESDGTVKLYEPTVSLLGNIALDHKPIAELVDLFGRFLRRTRGPRIVNVDCPRVRELMLRIPDDQPLVTYGLSEEADVRARELQWRPEHATFTVDDTRFALPLPGIYNVYNALATLAVCRAAGVPDAVAADALKRFRGVGRRMEMVTTARGVSVYDDYAHNPHKIEAAIRALGRRHPRVLAIFQLHGFGPARLMREELVEVLSTRLREADVLFMPEIYYAGGTVTRDISAADIVAEVVESGRRAEFVPEREALPETLAELAAPGDAIVIMGARDPSLSALARRIAAALAAAGEERQSA